MQKTLVYLIHGIGIPDTTWWGNTKEALEREQNLTSITFKYYPYETKKFDSFTNLTKNFFGNGKVLADLEGIGRNLISSIIADKEDEQFDNIILFGHSMGGFIAANAVNYVNSTPVLDSVRQTITHVILCGTPLGGSNLSERAEYLPYPKSLHAKSLLKDSCSREIMAHRLKNNVSKGGSKTNLSFISIVGDEVVITPEEKFGIFLNLYDDGPTIIGSHSGVVQNLSSNLKNMSIVSRHFEDCLNSPIITQKRIHDEPLKALEDNFLTLERETKTAKKSYYNYIKDILRKKVTDHLINSKNRNEENTFFDLKIFHRNTFLKNSDNMEDRKSIFDLNRTIEIVDGSRNTVVELYTGFERDSSFASKEFIEDTLIASFKKSLLEPTDRFNKYSFSLKKINRKIDGNIYSSPELLTINMKNITLEFEDSPDKETVGFLAKIDLGELNPGDIVELLQSYTLPTTQWIENFVDKPVRITLPRHALESEMHIQEERYGTSTAQLVPTVINKFQEKIYIKDKTSLYYKTFTAFKLFDPTVETNEPLKIEIKMDSNGSK